MLTRILLVFGLSVSLPLKAGWQGFQRYDFNTGHPWSYKPDPSYAAMLSGQVRWEDVSLLHPYSSFGFAFGSACHSNWRAAWSEITHNHCQSNTWGPVEKKCTRDLFVVLPCESEVLGMSREELAGLSKDFEDFLASEGERKVSQAANNKYATLALERVSKIYSAFHERKALEKQEAFKEEVRKKVGAQFSEAMKEIEGKRRLMAACDSFTESFLVLCEKNRNIMEAWTQFRNVRLPQEKTRFAQYNTDLSSRMSNAQLNWENFRSNERALLDNSAALDKDILAWDDLTQVLMDFHAQLESLLNSFKGSNLDDFWTGSDSARDSLLTANHSYVQNIASMINSSKKRADELRTFRQQYVSMLQTYQTHFIERIALHEKKLYTESRKELELQKEFSETILRLTTPVHQRPTKADVLNIPFLYDRYQILTKMLDQKYLCTGDLDNWKKSACKIGLRNIAIAEKEIESLKTRTFKTYSKILVTKAEKSQVDSQRLKDLAAVSDRVVFEEALKVYDAILFETNRIAKDKQAQP